MKSSRTCLSCEGSRAYPLRILFLASAFFLLLVATASVCLLPRGYPGTEDTAIQHAETVPDCPPPVADAGEDFLAGVGDTVVFYGIGCSRHDEIIEYQWDFESDGVSDYISAKTGITTHRYEAPGRYRAALSVKDADGVSSVDVRWVTVVTGPVEPGATYPTKRRPNAPPLTGPTPKPPDCIRDRYAVIISGSGEARFWPDVELTYRMLVDGYGFSPADVYLLNYTGTNPQGENPDNMIDDDAWTPAVEWVLEEIAGRADRDDEVYIWLVGHGRGYEGSNPAVDECIGYLCGRASVDEGDEPDYPESDFVVRSLFTGGDCYSSHGLNVWRAYIKGSKHPTRFYRHKFVSRFDSLYVEGLGHRISDDDVFIERLIDYPLGDTNRDGYIDYTLGEIFDFDGDGVEPFDTQAGTFDEDDWGAVDEVEDDYNKINGRLTVGAYPIRLFDEDHQGKLCVDLGYDETTLEVDGRDEDGQGCFDWMDANQDGDLDDIVSIDEAICLPWGDLYDDELAALVDLLPAAKVLVVANVCFAGGFIEDLSGDGRIICTSSEEEAYSWGSPWYTFTRGVASGLYGEDEEGIRVDADYDRNGFVSIVEAFNYAASVDPFREIPQYDDNGDAVSHAYPIPAGGEGLLGGRTFLCDTCSTTVCPGDPCSRIVRLLQNHPNPFSYETEIYYWLPRPSRIRLSIYDIRGKWIDDLVWAYEEEGPHTIRWRGLCRAGHPLPSGVYFYQLEVEGYGNLTGKMLVLR